VSSRVVLAGILAAGALLRGYAISRPWAPSDHDGWGGAFYSNIARNYLRYGLAETKLAPVVTTGRVPAERHVYYLTHPPFIGLSVASSFGVFGEREWAARVVPLAFSLGSVVLVYAIGASVGSRAVGTWAALLAAFVPMGIVYGAHVDPQGPPVTFFALAMVESYRRRRWRLCLAALLVGAGFDWPVHYMSALLAVHAVLARGNARRFAFILPVVSVLWVAAFLSYARYVAPTPERNYLGKNAVESFSFWSGREVDPKRIPGYRILRPSVLEWGTRLGRYYAELFTPPLLLLALWGAVLVSRRHEGAGLLLVLALWGVLHVALFPMGAFVHDYWSDYLTPALCLFAAVSAERLALARTYVLAVLAVGLLGLFTYLGLSRIERSRREEASLGPWLNRTLAPGEGVLSLLPLDVRDTYYADRPFKDGVNRVQAFEAALRHGDFRYRYFLVPRDFVADRPEKPLFQLVERTYPRFTFGGFFVYELAQPDTGGLRP